MSQTNALSFKGQNFFIGIDVHASNWKVTVRSDTLCLKTMSMDPKPGDLHKFLVKTYPEGNYYSVYEAGFCGFWIHRKLVQLGINNMIINPSDIPTTHKEKDRKSDPVDSNKLSRELRNGSLRGIYVPDTNTESTRVLSRALRQYSQRTAQIKNRIKGLLRFVGADDTIDVDRYWSKDFLDKISSYKFAEENSSFVMKHHIDELMHTRKMQLSLLRRIRKLSNGNKIIALLRTIPGIGTTTAFTLYAELVDMRRFANFDNLASFVGLVPSTSSTSDNERVRGITSRHCRHLRFRLIEAAWIAVRKDPVFTVCFETACKNMKKNDAIIRMAKKLLRRIRAVWIYQQPYVCGLVEVAKEPASKNVLL